MYFGMRYIALFLLFTNNAIAADLGKQGNVFPIEEESFQEMIIRKLGAININKYNKQMEEKMEQIIKNPTPILAITKATENREYLYDPSYVLGEDIFLSNGAVLYKKGHKINPLDFMDFDRNLYFIDALDESQIDWFTQEALKSDEEVRLILVRGSPLEVSDRLNISAYFDQFAHLTKQFGILHVPAMVWHQEGEMCIRVKEVALEE
jgi:conjugal transfer pilus assembly protein TraW